MLEHAELTRQRALLARFHGSWSGEELLVPSPWAEAGTATGHVTLAPDLGDILLTQNYQQERQGRPGLTLRGVFTVDPQQGDVLYYAFDTFGFPPLAPARGRWEGNTLTVSKSTPRGEARHRFAWQGDRYLYTIENRLSGQEAFTPFLTATYFRQEGP